MVEWVLGILVKRSFSIVPIQLDTKYAALEVTGVEFICLRPKLQLFVVYRPPYHDMAAVSYMQLLSDCLSHYTSNKCVQLVTSNFPVLTGIC